MRILHVLDHSIPVHTAYSHRTLSLLRQQRALGWHTIQLTGPAQGKVETEDRNRDGWHFIRTRPGPEWLPPSLLARRMARRLRHAIRLSRPDLLHAHPPALNAIAALWAGWRSDVPVLVEMHGGTRSAADNYIARAAAAVVTDSFALRAGLLAGGAAEGRISVIPPAIDPARQPAGPWPAYLPGQGGPLLAYAGPFGQRDGVHLLIAAMAPLLRVHPALRLVLAGAGPAQAQAQLMQLAGVHGAAVLFPGQPERESLTAIYAAADLVLFPALPTRSFMVARKPLEAMAHGALVLASDIGPHRELVDHGRNGILFEAGSVDSLVESVLALLAEPGCMQPLRERARTFAEVERGWETAARSYGPVYKRLLECVGR
ncbi:glycosyltransferase [Massilia sp. RP-1-19]|uniref:Glycosyltransferase n=1 Tax=Massilia polaris TaxID=2728846 RepID=A0A848HGV3_9BURK|nr:glycosyltransferase family 4 protein [Massilia polaris]NML60192.1 glycosyltransferase [Massilia polaris]